MVSSVEEKQTHYCSTRAGACPRSIAGALLKNTSRLADRDTARVGHAHAGSRLSSVASALWQLITALRLVV
jgi:hypothetical protein